MKIKPECAICIVRQVVDAVKEISKEEEVQFKLISSTLSCIKKVYGPDAVPAWMGTEVHRYLKKISGNKDPYRYLKDRANKLAIEYIKSIEESLKKYNYKPPLERLRYKIKLAIAGNVIDFGPYSTDVDIDRKLKETLEEDLKIDHSRELLEDLKEYDRILYICDNAGEILFDKILLEELKEYCEVVASVKGGPILNDATLEDARYVGLDKVVKVVTTGCDVIGVNLEESSEEFLKEFKRADIIIAKGMGNFESLTEYSIDKPVYYIFKAKCLPVAQFIDVEVGDNILLKKLQK
ncbi:MAG TPA: DUF89 domain-containing protein [Methanothermococcus okinawensis]|nr:DUF89 domain-containing protein [Methanothermococcus okinawensis]